MNCNFDNDSATCGRCGKKAPSRKAKSNCLPTMTQADHAALIKMIGDIHPQLEHLPIAGAAETVSVPASPAPPHGPGTELKKLLAKIGITATPNCKCNARVKHMDTMEKQEPGWCERNIDTVVGYLREAAADRGLPFLDVAGRVLVRRAISNARKEAARAEKAANAEGSEAKPG